MPTNTRLSGHELQYEGAPYRLEGRRAVRIDSSYYATRAGEGRGLCSCGAYSKVLPSAAARKRWHAEHKDAVRASSS